MSAAGSVGLAAAERRPARGAPIASHRQTIQKSPAVSAG